MKEKLGFFLICCISFTSFNVKLSLLGSLLSLHTSPSNRLLLILAVKLSHLLEGSPSVTSLFASDPPAPHLQMQFF